LLKSKSIALSGLDDASLVKRVCSGDIAAENEVVKRYQAGLKTILFNKAKDQEVVDEVLQDTWVIVLTKIRARELRDPSKLRIFIIQVGKNQLLMYYRSRSKQAQRFQPYDQEYADHDLSADQQLENMRLGKTIVELFEKLSKQRDREILEKFYVKGSTKQILCKEYQLSNAHFDRVLYRARERFKTLWQKSHDQN